MLMELSYNRQDALDYAREWAFSRNTDYLNYEKLGGDCTNFASQCIYAGTGVMNYTPVYGWYYRSGNDKSASWTGVPYLYNFLIDNDDGVGPFGEEAAPKRMEPGDLRRDGYYYHSLIVVETGKTPAPGNIKIATHTDDAYMRPLDSYTAESIRYVHITGFRKYK